jgi:5-oxoprolinase (ATP-hydrolysing) subunit A
VPGDRRTIDLNADVGEAGDDTGIGVERALLELVSTVHIACGGHAGDEASMRETVRAAMAAGVAVGAHPSYPDRDGFGRRPMELAAGDLRASLAEQIGSLVAVAESEGARVRSVKPHGALYAEVGRGGTSCDALRTAVQGQCETGTALVLPAGSPAVQLMAETGIPVLQEGFSDRSYAADGGLVGRQEAGAVLAEPAEAAAQARRLAVLGSVVARDGSVLPLTVDTLCVHGDSPNAVAMAVAVRRVLADAGVMVAAPTFTPG